MISKIQSKIERNISNALQYINIAVNSLNSYIVKINDSIKLYKDILIINNNSFTPNNINLYIVGQSIELIDNNNNLIVAKISTISNGVITLGNIANGIYEYYYINLKILPVNEDILPWNIFSIKQAVFMYCKYLSLLENMDNINSYTEGNISENFGNNEKIQDIRVESIKIIEREINKKEPNLIKNIQFL